MKVKITFLFFIVLFSCTQPMNKKFNDPYIVVLGIAQDAGYPQAGCNKKCCQEVWEKPEKTEYVSCIGLVDPISNEQWIFDATPDIKFQIHHLEKQSEIKKINGIFLTHAHIGHYTGLMHIGKEAMGYSNLPVYCMPRMQNFLKNNAPWDQLVNINNINLVELKNDSFIRINERIKIKPILVPHRDEYSETVGYLISSNQKQILYVPDIDKWDRWNISIVDMIKKVDHAFLDATFYADGELDRDMSKIPHPFVKESMELFSELTTEEKNKVNFIHLNHTNPLLIEESDAKKNVEEKGFNVAKKMQVFSF